MRTKSTIQLDFFKDRAKQSGQTRNLDEINAKFGEMGIMRVIRSKQAGKLLR